jgi:hypothetical protein
LITRNAAGGAANGGVQGAHGISADGRYVLFSSDADDLPGGLTIGYALYRLDRLTGALQNVIVDVAGAPRTATFVVATMTANGRFVAFASAHADLVPGDTNNRVDQFLRDLQLGGTERLSVGSGGLQGNGNSSRPAAVSSDGRFAVFATSSTNLEPVLTLPATAAFFVVRDRALDTTRAVAISPFGLPATAPPQAQLLAPCFLDRTHTAVFATLVPLLSTTTPTSSIAQVFAVDADTGAIRAVANRLGESANASAELPAVSANGRHIVFASAATNLDPTALTPAAHTPEVFLTSLDCAATSNRIGNGTAGSGGIVPLLFGTDAGCNGAITAFAGGTLGGAPMLLLTGAPAAPALPFAGIDIQIDLQQPFTLVPVPNGGLPGVAGTGSWFTQLPVAALNNAALTMQIVCLDPAAIAGLSATNGLLVQAN